MALTTNVIFTGLSNTGISTLFQAVTGSPSHSSPDTKSHQRHQLHRSYDFISCIDMPGLHPSRSLQSTASQSTSSQSTASQSTAPNADVLVLLIDSDITSAAEMRLIEDQYMERKPLILVHSKMTLRVGNDKEVMLESYKDRIREHLALKLKKRNLPMFSVYFVDGLTFWDFTFEEADFLSELFEACGCDGSITPRKEQILRRGYSKIPPRGIMSVVTFESESKMTRAQFIKWWFPSPLPLEFLLFELSLSTPRVNKELTVQQLKHALLKKGVTDSDFILILASESLLYDEGKEVTKKLVQACRECEALLPACMIVSVIMPHLIPKVADSYTTSFMETVPVNPQMHLTSIQREIVDRINAMHTSKDSVLLLLNRALAVLRGAQLLVGPGEAFLNAIAYWYTHYSTTYFLTVSYIAAMMGFSSILVSLILW